MKGFIIFEDFKKLINCKEILDGDYNCVISDYPNGTFSGVINRVTGARCNKDDTYDFETGALIALMKMCGVEKVKKAAKETFFEVAENAVNEYEEEIKKLRDEIIDLDYRKTCNETTIELLYNTINTLSGIDDKYKELKEENEKLQHEYDLCKNSENALKCSVDYLNKTIAKLNNSINIYKEDLYKVTKRCEELEIKESTLNKQQEQLDKREERLSVYFGGRGCSKQYKALVEMFKKLDKKKVQEAYKEAYNTTLPLWQKEVLKQLYDIYEESKEKTVQIKGFNIKIKPPTKREEMWEKILNASKNPPVDIKVAKQDIKTFLKELQDKIPEAMWNGSDDCLPSEYTNPYWFKHDYIFFALFRYDDKEKLRICYDDHKHSWIDKPVIEYIAPMRWDLFKKGRLAVKVDYDNYKEFYEACKKELGKRPLTNFACIFTVSICKKDGFFEILTVEDQKKRGRKIVDWEDVR